MKMHFCMIYKQQQNINSDYIWVMGLYVIDFFFQIVPIVVRNIFKGNTLARWLSWLERRPIHQKAAGLISSRAYT